MEITSPDTKGLVMSKRYQHGTSPETIKLWEELKQERKVAVVYYLSRNGQLDHPHFMEVSLSSSQGLYLKDVTSTLNILRGQGMASMYSWSSKRSYRNGYVWQDLSGNDFIHPCNGHEYILKGSLLIQGSLSCRSLETTSSSSSSSTSKISSSVSSLCQDSNSPVTRRRNDSWSTMDKLEEESKVYKAKTTGEFTEQGSNAATQTGNINGNEKLLVGTQIEIIEHEQDEVDKVHRAEDIKYERCGNDRPSGRISVSLLLMRLLGCGSREFKNFDDQRNTRH